MRELILYIAQKEESDLSFGRTKLAKLLFFSDFEAYGRLGAPITGADYHKRQFGPAARQFLAMRTAMLAEGVVKEERGEYSNHRRLVALREPDTSVFSKYELALIDEIIEENRPITAGAISDKSHVEMGWRLAAFNERIPYEAVFLAPSATEDDIRRGKELALEHDWVDA